MTENLGNIQNNLEFLGTARIRYHDLLKKYIYHLDYYQSDNHLMDQQLKFWAKVSDVAGNFKFIQTIDRHTVSKYSFIIDNFNDIYYLSQATTPVSGILNNYDGLGEGAEGVDLSVFDGNSYVSLNIDSESIGTGGSFSIEWSTENLPVGLEGAKIPVSYTRFDQDGGNFDISSENFGMIGRFRDVEVQEVAFITRNPYNELYIFEHHPDTIYDWTRYFGLKYSANPLIEALQVFVFDIDDDDLDEIIIRTRESIILVNYTGSIFEKTEFLFSDGENDFILNHINPIKIAHNSSHIFISNGDSIHSLFFNSTSYNFEYDDTLILPLEISKILIR